MLQEPEQSLLNPGKLLLLKGLLLQAFFVLNASAQVVSLAPSVTEVILNLGAGSELVGVTDYCQTSEVARIGGFTSPNLEAILSKKPRLVIGVREQKQTLSKIEKLGLAALEVDHSSLEGVVSSYSLLGSAMGVNGNHVFQDKVEELKDAAGGVSAAFLLSDGALFIACEGSIYASLAEHMGLNLVCESPAPYARISNEGLLSLKADLLIELSMKETHRKLPGTRVINLTGERYRIPGEALIEIMSIIQRTVDENRKPLGL